MPIVLADEITTTFFSLAITVSATSTQITSHGYFSESLAYLINVSRSFLLWYQVYFVKHDNHLITENFTDDETFSCLCLHSLHYVHH